MKTLKVTVALGATVLCLGLVSTTALGRNLRTGGSIVARFERINFAGGFGTTECLLVLEGTLHSKTMAKMAGSLVGYIDEADRGACVRGAMTILYETLPWHIRYKSFSGRLPRISWITLEVTGMAFRIREPVFGITCLASGGIPQLHFVPLGEGGGFISTVEISGRSPTNCGAEGTLSGTESWVTDRGEVPLLITLI